mgnify:CR=1 FL=1
MCSLKVLYSNSPTHEWSSSLQPDQQWMYPYKYPWLFVAINIPIALADARILVRVHLLLIRVQCRIPFMWWWIGVCKQMQRHKERDTTDDRAETESFDGWFSDRKNSHSTKLAYIKYYPFQCHCIIKANVHNIGLILLELIITKRVTWLVTLSLFVNKTRIN